MAAVQAHIPPRGPEVPIRQHLNHVLARSWDLVVPGHPCGDGAARDPQQPRCPRGAPEMLNYICCFHALKFNFLTKKNNPRYHIC